MPRNMKILTAIIFALAALVVGCAIPTDSDESTHEARSAIVIFHNMSAVKSAIDGGATHSPASKAIVISSVNNFLAFTPGADPEEDAGSWSLSTSESGNYHVIGSVFDRIGAGTIQPDGSLFVPANTYMPSIDQYTSDAAYYCLTPVEHEALGLVALLQ